MIKRLLVLAALLLPLCVPLTAIAFAQADAPPVIASTPEAVVAADQDTSATIEWGNLLIYWLKGVQVALVTFLAGVAAWAATYLPGIAGMGARFLIANYGERLIQNLTDFAVNAVEGAAKGKKLDINVGSSVIAEAIERAMSLQNQDRLLKWVIKLLGGPEGIGEKVFRKIELEDAANKNNVLAAGMHKAGIRYPMGK